MNSKTVRTLHFCAATVGVTLVAACASTTPKAEFSRDLTSQYRIDADDHAQVNVSAGAGVEITDLEEQRIARLISSDLAPAQCG
jgi:hypothetical protein